MSVKIVGGDQYIQAVNKIAAKVPQAARETVKRYTVATQAQAVRLEPVKTGFLKRNTTIKIQSTTNSTIGTVTANAFNRGYNYGARQEFDTKLNHPNGGQSKFMYTAFEAQKAGFIRDIKGVLK